VYGEVHLSPTHIPTTAPPPAMNISQPVGSQIAGVSFGFLGSKDIRALSAKRITTATTFDTLLNPVPGGLYTPELGQFGDNNCATCGLKTPQCPGHCGHIELPVPCYHPTFMDQVLRLLRASCIYCGKLKLSRVHVNRFACKLRLVQYGLIKEIADLDDITAQMASKGKATTNAAGSSDEDDDEISGDAKELVETRDRFVKKAIKKARQEGRLTTHKTEALTNARRVIIQEFMGTITKGVKCSNCQGINHGYRKDRFVKIFRKPLKK